MVRNKSISRGFVSPRAQRYWAFALCLLVANSLVLGAQSEAQTGTQPTAPFGVKEAGGVIAEFFVEVRSAPLRSEPRHWGSVVTVVPFGERVEQIERPSAATSAGDDWVYVRARSGGTGFLHATALTSRVVIIRGSEAQGVVNRNENEIVLAGKGFSQDVESVFAAKNTASNFGAVDQLEARQIALASIDRFSREGGFNDPTAWVLARSSTRGSNG
jgi:hypothetical protein